MNRGNKSKIMTELETWLIGNAESITDIEYLTRIFILFFSLNIMAVVAHELASIGKR